MPDRRWTLDICTGCGEKAKPGGVAGTDGPWCDCDAWMEDRAEIKTIDVAPIADVAALRRRDQLTLDA